MKVLIYTAGTLRLIWWDNFVNESVEFFSINNALKPYGGRYRMTFCEDGYIKESWLEFERECDFTWFMMRYG